MNSKNNLQEKQISPAELNQLIVDSIQDVKGIDIVVMDLKGLDGAPTDFFIICHGTSNTQVKAIADRIVINLKKEHSQIPNHVEGLSNCSWVLVDYFNTVVHIFHQETREFYHIEDLWSDAKVTVFENL